MRAGRKSDKEGRHHLVTAVVANARGEIFDLKGFAAVGGDGTRLDTLTVGQTRRLPHGSELMRLPDRVPLLYDMRTDHVIAMAENPHSPGESIFPVAAFNSPGYLLTHTCAYEEMRGADCLPLFSYGAVGWHRDGFRSAVIRVEAEARQDLRRMPLSQVEAGIARMRTRMPSNRLRAHLESCARAYGCPAAKNFFLGRFEAPLPTATTCNAHCLGCLSAQPLGGIPCSQERITFTPSADEIAQVALEHIEHVEQAVVSFGQGCEGEPLTSADTIATAIKKIRAVTSRGTINMNTNGSRPRKIRLLLDAGLDSLRISMNSARPKCYRAYFRPRGYDYQAVVDGIDMALNHGAHVAINYLNCPGFTDTPEEAEALHAFIQAYPIQMIQWRNLNFDPQRYLRLMTEQAAHTAPLGVANLLKHLGEAFPGLRFGYFNPPQEKF